MKLMTATDVQEYLGVSRAFAYQLMKSGEIPVVRLGTSGRAIRVTSDDMEAYVLSHRESVVVEPDLDPPGTFLEEPNPFLEGDT